MEATHQWVHFTSDENLVGINKHGAVILTGCTSERYDGVLVREYAPRGVWFNSNFYNGGLLSQTVYPERCNTVTNNVEGLVTTVEGLLNGHEWILLIISDVQDIY